MFTRRYGPPRTHQPRRDPIAARMEAGRARRYEAPRFGHREVHFYGPRRGGRCNEIDRRYLQNFHPQYAEEVDKDEKQRSETEDQLHIAQDQVAKLETLTVEDLDLKIKGNAFLHKTLRYHCVKTQDNQPVFRRGQEFTMTVTFSRPYQKEKDDLHFLLETEGDNPCKNLRAMFTMDEERTTPFEGEDDWGARIIGAKDKQLDVAVYIPRNCVVGEWEVKVKTTLVGSKDDYVFTYPKPVTILFNPWCKTDQVYYKEEKDLDEYIMNDAGTVFVGTASSIGSKPWAYGQFEKDILQTSLHLLRKAFDFRMTPCMADPVEVSRAVTRAVNSSDDEGVLAGNWSGDYSGGKSPLSWVSSADILRQYAKEGKPVKYGQCWVFSHVLTAVCRALGLPCRSVTNFDSAHDTDNTCTIDHYFDAEGNKLKGGDSVWNFHVWNEVWILRPDLPSGYDGWHCIDATPQEQSLGVYQCGPCPVAAVKRGDIHIGYDTAFVFSEVNAEVVHWVVEDGDNPKVSSVEKNSVGWNISTKHPDGKPTPNDKHLNYWTRDHTGVRLDLTDAYKFPEGSSEEREAVQRAVRFTRHGRKLFNETSELKVRFAETEEALVGQDVVAKVEVKNVSKEDKVVAVMMKSRVTRYWDCSISDKFLAEQNFDEITLKPGEEREFQLIIPAEEYTQQCDDSFHFFVYACARDVKKNMPYSAQKPFRVRRPDLIVKGPETAKSGEVVTVKVSFTNPFADRPLTKCTFQMTGGMDVAEEDKNSFDSFFFMHEMSYSDVQPGKEMLVELKLKPQLRDDDESPLISTMNFEFSSSEAQGVTGAYTVRIEAARAPAQQQQGQQ